MVERHNGLRWFHDDDDEYFSTDVTFRSDQVRQ